MMNQPYSSATFFGIFKKRVEAISLTDMSWQRTSQNSNTVRVSGNRYRLGEPFFETIDCAEPLAILKGSDHQALLDIIPNCSSSENFETFFIALERIQTPDVIVIFRQLSSPLLQPPIVQAIEEVSYQFQLEQFVPKREDVFFEGRAFKVTLTKYERDPKARSACLRIHGLSCSICKFNFEEEFGEIGKGKIEVHHLLPISKGERYTSPDKGLRPICPNCHSIAHLRNPPFTIDEMREMRTKAMNRSTTHTPAND